MQHPPLVERDGLSFVSVSPTMSERDVECTITRRLGMCQVAATVECSRLKITGWHARSQESISRCHGSPLRGKVRDWVRHQDVPRARSRGALCELRAPLSRRVFVLFAMAENEELLARSTAACGPLGRATDTDASGSQIQRTLVALWVPTTDLRLAATLLEAQLISCCVFYDSTLIGTEQD